ncbi:MAG TPA: prolyl-tRNA synthetase associated domain-containing protein [Candidatus Saccharimonadales bacterium]|nr:prolyl-tRNA synthetase associated domain-containing protein [Candidatus Saccharimonadales bacterium]
MRDIYSVLEKIGIPYEEYEHPPVFTVEETEKYERGNGTPSKNLFLRNKKGNKHYLVVLEANKRIDLKNLEVLLQEKGLSFASSERMMQYLGLTPGSVSPLGLINDINQEVSVIVDKDLLKSEKQGFHPNVNTATLVIKTDDFKKFLDWTKNKITYVAI